jgi:hypothetical protein
MVIHITRKVNISSDKEKIFTGRLTKSRRYVKQAYYDYTGGKKRTW